MVHACYPGTQDVGFWVPGPGSGAGQQSFCAGLGSFASLLLAAAPTLRCQSWGWAYSILPGKLIQMFLSCGIRFLAGFGGGL